MGQRRLLALLSLVLLLLRAIHAQGQSPHEILLVANPNIPDALHIARDYQKLRKIPEGNVLILPDAPDSNTVWSINQTKFERMILEPVQAWIQSTWHATHPPCIVLSPGLPTKVRTRNGAEVSTTSLLQTGGWCPPLPLVNRGQYVNPWFAGPPGPRQARRQSRSYPYPGATRLVAPG